MDFVNTILNGNTGDGNVNFVNLINNAVRDSKQATGHFNVLIAGRSGVGKSTLINAIFDGNLATVGQGKPVTKSTREITKEGSPLSIFDTRGLEMAAFDETLKELSDFIALRQQTEDTNRHIHVAWLCIQEDSRRVEDAEIQLFHMLALHMPVLVVITKARQDGGFRSKVQELLPSARNVMRVRAIADKLDSGHIEPPMGLEDLVLATSELIPEGVRRALTAAQKASLELKKKHAREIINGAATAASAAGLSPIPATSAAILAPIQVGMIAAINTVFNLEVSLSTLSALLSSTLGVTSTALTARLVLASILKMIPGAGTAFGMVISASTAVAITKTLGEAYLSVLENIYLQAPDRINDMAFIGQQLKSVLKENKRPN
jgi:uncharacterized protein (DUF697 family)/GTP-binding protein EngB required for normal cell division